MVLATVGERGGVEAAQAGTNHPLDASPRALYSRISEDIRGYPRALSVLGSTTSFMSVRSLRPEMVCFMGLKVVW